MAERDTLLSTLPDDVKDEVDQLYTDSVRQDPRDILAELLRRGRITPAQLRDSVLSLEAKLRIRRIKEKPPQELEPTVLGPLGEGAMGEVLLARDEGLNRVVALKRLHPDHANHKGLLRRFYTEAQVTAQLDHPSIVPIHGVYPGEDGSIAYSMKLVRGQTLEDYIDEARKQTNSGSVDQDHNLQARLLRFLHACDAIAYAHSKGVLHRDLKPENIMVGAFGEVLVMDWGIAKLLEGSNVELVDEDAGKSRPATETRVGRVVGTPRYMSPEQAAGKNDVIDSRSDQYALGLILQELVTFTPACPEKITLEQALARAQGGARQKMSAAVELVAIVDKACALHPDSRYDSVHALAEDVRAFLRDEPIQARRDSINRRLGRFVSRHRTATVVTILLLGFGLAGTAMALTTVGTAAFGWRTYAQAAAEERYQEALDDTTRVAQMVDSRLSHIEALAVGLSFAAERSFSERDKEKPDVEGWPFGDHPNLSKQRPSKVYGRKVMASVPTLSLADKQRPGSGVPSSVREDVFALAQLGAQVARALGDSSNARPDKALDRRTLNKLMVQGVPLRWVRIATPNGVMATAPGGEKLKRGIDPRNTYWFKEGRGRASATWHVPPAADPDLKELVLTVSHPVHSANGRSVEAVVSLDYHLDTLIHTMQQGYKGTKTQDGWILDPDVDGRPVLVASREMKGKQSWSDDAETSARLWNIVKANPGSGFRVRGIKLYTWATLPTTGWILIAERSNG